MNNLEQQNDTVIRKQTQPESTSRQINCKQKVHVQAPCCFCLPVSEQILGFYVQDYDEAETERGYDSKRKEKITGLCTFNYSTVGYRLNQNPEMISRILII